MANFDSHHIPDSLRDPRGAPPGVAPAAEVVPPLVDPALQRRPMITAVRWGAVIAGVAVGLSVQLALTLLGVATGISTTNVAEGDRVGIGPLLWAGASMLVSAFVGGYVSARMSGLKRKADGILHGAVSWAVTTILFAVLAASIGGALVGGVFNNMSQLAQVQEQAAQGEGALSAFMRDQFGQLAPPTLAQLRFYLQHGEREQAVQLLTFAGGMEARKAEEIVDHALILAGTPEKAGPQETPESQESQQAQQTQEAQQTRPDSRAPAQREVPDTLQGSGTAAWVVFGAVALGLLLGMGGGRLGVAGARRVNWAAEAR